MLDSALTFALAAHAGQFREGPKPLPYITHPIEVLVNLRYIGSVTDQDMLCAAVLHDVVEQSDATATQLSSRFGDRVQRLVLELTREEPSSAATSGLSKSEVWALRSSLLLNEISRMSDEAKTIKLADRLSNLRDAKRTKKREKYARYVRQTLEILRVVDRSVNSSLWDAIQAECLADLSVRS